MKKKKYLDLYYDWIETGTLPEHGVCDSIRTKLGDTQQHKFLSLFQPGPEWRGLWGYDGNDYTGCILGLGGYPGLTYEQVAYEFNDLRQNMILLMAAMNKEL